MSIMYKSPFESWVLEEDKMGGEGLFTGDWDGVGQTVANPLNRPYIFKAAKLL